MPGIDHSQLPLQVITNLSRKATSAITGPMLFTIKRVNAIQTLLDMIAASASLATMAKTRHRKKPWVAKISSSFRPRRRINTWGTLTCPGTTSAIMWWLWPHMKRSTTPSWPTATQQHSFHYYYAARGTIFPHNMTRGDIDFANDVQGFPTWHRLYNTVE